ncbi:4Fe-4S ferredoxin, iron-sulfur binding domain protein [Alkaliphilus metalliredigens QYMF]|uniref:4Fe-4S ferredoxin, iron-sulfur binding domain protein n=1 Tax=Alkaliphilus metalliredigens (strain QYMF) TaxID=293826 RepID=A6TMW6_ALKMQ|nr:4Fe-4S dicluster domain-containing protein [Alkaliphilus metalliredigens]ABR47534.1 4Fe-4S ferredoxin, iron-sulfur binding domain protein [Alkaliphilus metalliredigens QYMF]
MLTKYLVKKIMSERHAIVKGQYCLNVRNKKEKCRKCIEICPVEAIKQKETIIVIDKNSCNGCGICNVVCPSQALELSGLSKKIDNSKLDKKAILIGCQEHNEQMDIMFSCLNGIHAESIAALLLKLKEKDIYFNVIECKNCNIESDSFILENALKEAKKFIDSLKITINMELIYKKEHLPIYDETKLTRRELLSLITKKSGEITQDITNHMFIDSKEGNLNHREGLLNAIENLGEAIDENTLINESLFTTWDVNLNCDGCSFCQAICPWNSWQIEENEDQLVIKHSARTCRSCELCFKLCPNKAIERASCRLYYLQQDIIKREIHLISCSRCFTKYILKDNGVEVCPSCARSQIRRFV